MFGGGGSSSGGDFSQDIVSICVFVQNIATFLSIVILVCEIITYLYFDVFLLSQGGGFNEGSNFGGNKHSQPLSIPKQAHLCM
jgi:hypothetical protein